LLNETIVSKIKEELYCEINEIDKQKIQKDVTSDIQSSKKYINLILNRCIKRLIPGEVSTDHDKIVVTLGEAILHFMLTICTLPSERKIGVEGKLVIDIIVPNLRILKINASKSIIIQFIKERHDLNKISHLHYIQPNYENIWLILHKPLTTTKYKTYNISPNSFSNIIVDVHTFLEQSGDKSLRVFSSK
jgi:hypothetical protein